MDFPVVYNFLICNEESKRYQFNMNILNTYLHNYCQISQMKILAFK